MAAGTGPAQSRVWKATMAYANDLHTTDAAGWAAPFAKGRQTLGARFARWRLYRQTVAELGALSARELNDLGITHGDIGRVARESAYGG